MAWAIVPFEDIAMNYHVLTGALPNGGRLFVDHSPKQRSGHISHALVEYRKDCLLAFYSNCSGFRNPNDPGHNGFGWIEYKRSTDGGDSWSNPFVLDYTMECFLNQPFTVSCEKAVSPAENVIIAFCIRNTNPNAWEPHLEPMILRSEDGGLTWSEARQFCDVRGRIYDALVHDGVIYVLMMANERWQITSPDHHYQIYASYDGGVSFGLLSQLPDENLMRHAYGSMIVRPDGAFVCYTYNADDEYHMDYFVSYDGCHTWTESGLSYCAKRIRNPQVAVVRGGYVLHGRSGAILKNRPVKFVLYTSTDGIHWDDGVFICDIEGPLAYYSNNIVLNRDDGSQRLLIQSSVPYDNGRVNIAHWILEIE